LLDSTKTSGIDLAKKTQEQLKSLEEERKMREDLLGKRV
jgi:hypothetical protein